jgi:hypothetical protein
MVLYALLDGHLASGRSFDLHSGDDPIEDALSRLGG